jgi:hypothetical protein
MTDMEKYGGLGAISGDMPLYSPHLCDLMLLTQHCRKTCAFSKERNGNTDFYLRI